jgi:hypothetical protein
MSTSLHLSFYCLSHHMPIWIYGAHRVGRRSIDRNFWTAASSAYATLSGSMSLEASLKSSSYTVFATIGPSASLTDLVSFVSP